MGAHAEAPRVRELSTSLEKIRGLKFRQSVPSQAISQREATDYVRSLFDQEAARTPYAVRETFLKQIGLLPPTASLRGSLRELYGEQVRGLYDPYRKVFIVVEGAEADPQTEAMSQALGISMDDLLTVHELQHALQDQHFNLRALDQATYADFDRSLALQSLVEGDAYLVMFDYAAVSMGVDPSMFEDLLTGQDLTAAGMDSSPVLARSPPFVRKLVTDPYSQGMVFCVGLRRKGGWTTVNNAFRRLPASTEQILHPDKYLRNEGPVAIAWEPPARVGPLKRIGHDTAGEFTVRALGDVEAAEGWGGDRYWSYGSDATVWMTAWDTDRDAAQFERLAKQLASRKSAPGRRSTVLKRGRKVLLVRNMPATYKPSL